MVYRITKDGKELEISDVIEFGKYLSEKLGDIIMPLTLLYHGSLGDMYPELDRTNHWHENLLELMRTDKRFAIEDDEPLCRTKVPREGIVIRRCNDPVPEAFKLKGDRFRFREAKQMDAGEVDIEMQEGYVENGGE